MARMKYVLVVSVVALVAGGAVASPGLSEDAETQAIEWNDLLPDNRIDDPYALLTTRQLQDLAHVARIRKLLAAEKLSADGTDAKEVAAMEAKLAKEGLDVDLLLSLRDQVRRLREIQGKAVQPKLEGKTVQLAGFVVPLKETDGRVREFFLVSSYDACTHSTPPPPNQTVYGQSPDGFTLADRRVPVRVTGRLVAKVTTSLISRVEGPTRVSAAYRIEPTAIEVYTPGTKTGGSDTSKDTPEAADSSR